MTTVYMLGNDESMNKVLSGFVRQVDAKADIRNIAVKALADLLPIPFTLNDLIVIDLPLTRDPNEPMMARRTTIQNSDQQVVNYLTSRFSSVPIIAMVPDYVVDNQKYTPQLYYRFDLHRFTTIKIIIKNTHSFFEFQTAVAQFLGKTK